MNDLLDIERRGWCDQCKHWHILEKGKNSLPIHEGQDKGVRCSSSGYSYNDFKYFIKTLDEAIAVAQFIKEDEGGCFRGGKTHSMACGDGRDCAHKRFTWAKALAEYLLTHQK